MIAGTTTNTMPGKRGAVCIGCNHPIACTHTHRPTQRLHTDTLLYPVAALQVRTYPLAGFDPRAFSGRANGRTCTPRWVSWSVGTARHGLHGNGDSVTGWCGSTTDTDTPCLSARVWAQSFAYRGQTGWTTMHLLLQSLVRTQHRRDTCTHTLVLCTATYKCIKMSHVFLVPCN